MFFFEDNNNIGGRRILFKSAALSSLVSSSRINDEAYNSSAEFEKNTQTAQPLGYAIYPVFT